MKSYLINYVNQGSIASGFSIDCGGQSVTPLFNNEMTAAKVHQAILEAQRDGFESGEKHGLEMGKKKSKARELSAVLYEVHSRLVIANQENYDENKWAAFYSNALLDRVCSALILVEKEAE